jgi:hypothetical protein
VHAGRGTHALQHRRAGSYWREGIVAQRPSFKKSAAMSQAHPDEIAVEPCWVAKGNMLASRDIGSEGRGGTAVA